MVVVKYQKIDEGMFFSHLNMIRIWNRLLAIAAVEVKFSEGFSKTRRIFFGSPTRVGVESLCEYIIIDTDEKAKSVKSKIENMLPNWLVLVDCYKISSKFNIANLNTSAKYFVTFDEYKSTKPKVEKFFQQDKIEINVVLHGTEKTIDVKNRIIKHVFEEQGLTIYAGVGSASVRIDELVKKMLHFINKQKNDFTIQKQALFATNEAGEQIEIDKMIQNIKEKE